MRRGAGTWPGPDHVARGRRIPVGTAGSRPYTQPATKRRTGAAPTHTTCSTSSRAGRPATAEAPAFVTPHPTRGVGCNGRDAPPFCVGARAGTIMVWPSAPGSFRLRGQSDIAAIPRRRASDRPQSKPNLEGRRSSLGHFWFHPLSAAARDRPKDCLLGTDSGGRVGGVPALLGVAPTSARCSCARCRLEAKPQ